MKTYLYILVTTLVMGIGGEELQRQERSYQFELNVNKAFCEETLVPALKVGKVDGPYNGRVYVSTQEAECLGEKD